MSNIHPTAVVGTNVSLGKDVVVGPFCVIKGQVSVGDGTVFDSHVCVGSDYGIVEIGSNNKFAASSVIGGDPQDLKYKNEPTKLIIGDNNNIREYVTLNTGTVTGHNETRIGNNNLIMAYVHVAHDCILGNNIIVANVTQFAGHVVVEDNVTVGGNSSITQFTRLGRFSYIGAGSGFNKDVPPFCIADGHWGKVRATNKVGLERNGFSKDDIKSIYKALRKFSKSDLTTSEIIESLKEENTSDHLQELIRFVEQSKKGIAR